MALKIWTFLLVMSLPAAEHGRGFGSSAAVVSNSIDYGRIGQKPYADGGGSGDGEKILFTAAPSTHRNGHRIDKRATSKISNKNHYYASSSSSAQPSADGRCMARVQSALGDMLSAATVNTKSGNRRHTTQPPSPPSGVVDLSGYALHQRLRTAPGAEMYVTGMRAKVMPPSDDGGTGPADVGNGDRSWARVDGCRYDPLGNVLEARMRFGRTIMVMGSVRLLYGGGGGGRLSGETGCDMTLRLRPRAGLGFTAVPLTMPEKSPSNRLTAMPTMTIRTTATFIDPEPTGDPVATYVSVHSYNCVGGPPGFVGNREHPATASSDRYEQFLSADNEDSDELFSGVGGEFDIDMDEENGNRESAGSDDKRSSSGRPTPATSNGVTPATSNAFVSAGFVTLSPSPEPRIRRIQYHSRPPQHPILTVANGNHQQAQDQLLMEMEDVFVRGVRSLLAKHLERTLKPALKDSLMANMGYTVSYG